MITLYHLPKLRYRTGQLYSGKWRKFSKSRCDNDLDLTMPMSK